MSTELIERPPSPFTALTATDIKDQVKLIQDVMEAVMQEGHHYGAIPGTPKPTLLKPGAEKLSLTFRLRPEYDILPSSVLTETERAYRLKCRLVHIRTGESWGEGVGSCSSRERKYRKTIGKVDKDGFETLVDDVDNTIFKMAAKRAHVAAVLSATAASDIFTQDLEELPPADQLASQEKSRPEPSQAPSRSHAESPSGLVLPFGKSKGKALGDPSVPLDDLQWVEGALEQSIADPEKAKYRRKNEVLREAICEEINRRAAEALQE